MWIEEDTEGGVSGSEYDLLDVIPLTRLIKQSEGSLDVDVHEVFGVFFAGGKVADGIDFSERSADEGGICHRAGHGFDTEPDVEPSLA